MICYTNKHKIPFQIDEEDYESVSNYIWNMHNAGYPVTSIRKYYNGIHIGSQIILLHTFLLGKSLIYPQIDHIDRDKLNNTRENLRYACHTLNNRNVGVARNNTSGHRGVTRDGRGWSVSIKIDSFRFYVGYFKTIEEAVIARKNAELTWWGTNY